ncbi:cupin domain-containing protein [Candidatus Xianfuyuplasma coldseepsis]|uniref:Cupin domain-containing protein n=1 Tax=Candidatus Xianfuyuplasma coldseepsis TaxID=2782163 RepID=A0A7L7KQD2_9MOLU|nr:cupin domain-containing protein [Xianfuyuplasma coldseepsis]QMS84639.1 cupin domain-containing protein [Xianfuyuplasma coldseepsis]
MIVGHLEKLDGKVIESSQVQDVMMKVLVSPKEGWDGHVMRVFEVGIDGYTPKHQHPWPHINYIIDGVGSLMIDHQEYQITSGSYAYVPSDTIHQFKNVGEKPLKFICIVPEEGHK